MINQNYTISIRLRTYSSFKAALTAGKVSMLGNCPNLVRDSLYITEVTLSKTFYTVPYNTGLVYESVTWWWGYDKKILLATCREFVKMIHCNRTSKLKDSKSFICTMIKI